jgi:hypothetical protein
VPAEPRGGAAASVVSVAIAGGVAYAGALGIGLLSDDYVLRASIVEGRDPWQGAQFARPVALALWRAMWFAGGGAASLHLLNILLHIVSAVAAGAIAGRIGLSSKGAFIAAFTFLLWPTQVEPVAWAAGVFDVLATALIVTAVWICVRRDALLASYGDVLLVGGLSTLALFTKENAVALPVLALIALAPNLKAETRSPRQITLLLVTLLTTAGYLCWRLIAGLPLAGTSSFSRYVVKEQLSRTFGALAVPYAAETIQAFPIVAIVTAVGTVGLVAAAIVASPRRSGAHLVVVQGVLWCLVAALPTVGFLFIGPYLDGSRYLYLSTLGWGLMLGGLLHITWPRPYLRTAAVAFLVLVFVAVGVEQQRRLSDWRRAASLRDGILAQARSLAMERRCLSVTVSHLPQRFKGAQLFNNGFAEALRDSWTPGNSTNNCRWTWTGSTFLGE